MYHSKKLLVFIIVVNFLLVLSGCSSDNDGDGNIDNDIEVIENFVGSGGPGDFYSITFNMTDKRYSYKNLTTNSESGSGTFENISAAGNSGVFRLDTNDLMVKLEDEIVVVADGSSDPGERITVALEKPVSPYGTNITVMSQEIFQ